MEKEQNVDNAIIDKLEAKEILEMEEVFDIELIQKERQKYYGSYSENIECRDQIMMVLRNHRKNSNHASYIGFDTFLSDVVSKLVRLNNCNDHIDSIVDLKSYIDLWLKHVKGC